MLIRFRHADDEKKYMSIRAEMYIAVASRLPPDLATAVMRDFGKLEALLYYEGVRQGLAASALKDSPGMPPLDEMPFPSVLAHVYGSADTPLAAIERKHMDRFEGAERDAIEQHPWLKDAPMVFAPTTYAEFMGQDAEAPRMIRIDAPGPPVPVQQQRAAAETDDNSMPTPEQIARLFATTDDIVPGDSPQDIERCRDAISAMTKSGWATKSWPALVLALQRETGMQANYIDLILSGELGYTMLSQMGVDVRPGAGVGATDFETPLEGVLLSAALEGLDGQLASRAMADEPELAVNRDFSATSGATLAESNDEPKAAEQHGGGESPADQ